MNIWTPISRLLETEAEDMASDPKVHLAVSPKLLQVSPSAVLEKADEPNAGMTKR